MPEHKHFEEMCALASVGELDGGELAALEAHLADCPTCLGRYTEFLQLSALGYSQREPVPVLTAADNDAILESPISRARFLKRAEEEGCVFSPEAVRARNTAEKKRTLVTPSVARASGLIAAGALVVLSASLFGFRLGTQHATQVLVMQRPATSNPAAAMLSVYDQEQLRGAEQRSAELQQQVDQIGRQLAQERDRLQRAEILLNAANLDRQSWVTDHASMQQRVRDLQQQLAQAQEAQTASQRALAAAVQNARDSEATVVADQYNLNELRQQLSEKTASLNREQDMMQAGREVRDVMAARNLHIVDVFDTDSKGRTRHAFGRVFFTEGKSLIFYAYDLNDARLEKGNYQYRVWGNKEGDSRLVKSLGIFYADDHAQRRWVFKCNDAKVLNEIDSVFVTLERPGDARPRGQKLLEAYLRAAANHP